MLMKRVVTASVLIALCFVMLLWAPFWLQKLIIDLLVLGCGWEWAKIAHLNKVSHKLFFLSLLILSAWVFKNFEGIVILFFAPIWWVIALFLITRYRGEVWSETKGKLLGVLYGLFTLVPFWWSFKVILGRSECSQLDISAGCGNESGRKLVLFVLLVVWAVDTAAYFCGRRWGRHSLLPYVSPAKTWEGLIGGFLGAFVVIGLGYLFLGSYYLSFAQWCLLGLLLAGGAVLGDLFESMMKRQRGIKDSGSLLPGHGGLLDRLDSLMMTVPIFYSFTIVTFPVS